LCQAALERPEEQQRVFLELACGADQDLRREVESLLAHRRQAENFMEGRAVDVAARALAAEHSSIGFEASHFVGRLISHYRIVEKIASGGMGDVYRAVRADGSYDKQVAIKLIQGARSTDFFLARFQNERQILATLDHPNIARLLDGGTTEEGLPYVVMEYIQGLPIDEFCTQKVLDVGARLALFRTVCSAVQYAHQNLVVHRDLKPTNILVTAEGVPKLLDFGIAKILHPQHGAESLQQTVTLLQLLTPDYASPEQVRNEPISTSSDVYSLGVILYRLLTGFDPYRVKTDSLQEMMQAICESEPEKPSSAVMRAPTRDDTPSRDVSASTLSKHERPAKLGRILQGDLDNIVLKALRKEPQRRYSSVEQISEDLRRYLAGLPVLAHQDSLGYRASKFISRHKVGVASAMVIAVAMFAGLAATLYEAHIAQVQRARAESRFNDVRALANSLMFDVHDSIQDLPGSTPARKLLVDRALRYLDSLSRDSAFDASLQRELATAYEKVGMVQGDAFGANLGDTGGALESFRKASSIRESLLKADPQNADNLIALARIQRLIGAVLANRGDSACLLLLNQAIATSERAIRVAPSSEPALREFQADYRFLGTLLDGAGDYRASADNFQRAYLLIDQLLSRTPDDRILRRDMASVEMRLGHELANSGSRKEGTPHLQHAIELFESLSADRKDSEAARRLAVAHSYLAEALLTDGNLASALQHFKVALGIAKAVAAVDPTNAVAQLDLAFAYAALGNATALKGQPTAGLDLLNRAAKMFEAQLSRDPAYAEPVVDLTWTCMWTGETFFRAGQSARALASYQKALAVFGDYALRNKGTAMQADLALIHAEIGSSLAKLGKPGQAAEDFQRALGIVESMTSAKPNLLEAQYVLAYTYAGLGELSQNLASDRRRSRQQRIQDWNQARNWLQHSLDIWQKIPYPGMRTPMGFECSSPRVVTRELARCEVAMAELAQ
jgi:eukaryotic-like serine/threonine-protein kinase